MLERDRDQAHRRGEESAFEAVDAEGAGFTANDGDPEGSPLLPRGPKGGRTTRTRSGLVRKSLLVGAEEAQALRQEAYLTERSEAEIVREALRRFLGLPVDADDGTSTGDSGWGR